jgi:transposase
VYRDWVKSQPAKVRKMVGVITVDVLMEAGKTQRDACKIAEAYLGISERTLRRWRGEFYAKGEITSSNRKRRSKNPLITDEQVIRKAKAWLRMETSKRNSKLSISTFCRWVNNELVTSMSLPPSYPKSISRVTAWRWMCSLGFRFSGHQKGYIDEHEQEV